MSLPLPVWLRGIPLRVAVERLRRAVVLPLILALAPLFWVVDATQRASLTTLGRDQGIFQYIAWAILRGDVDYRDVRDVNGPLTHLIHVVFLLLGGADEHRFRVLDLTVTGISFAFVGACLPGIVSKARVSWLERLAWAAAGWVVLSGQHLLYLYWDLAQRETFFNWFMLSGVALQLVVQRSLASTAHRSARRDGLDRALLAVVGMLSIVPWFGKPTYVLFTFAQVAALLVDDTIAGPGRIGRLRALGFFGIGTLVGAASQLAFLFTRGDAAAFLRIYLVDVPTMYRFMLPRSAEEILALQWGGPTAAYSLATSLVLLALIWDRQMPRRALAVALLPLLGLVSVLAQRKGFPYHFHPATAGMHLQWLLFAAWLWERYRGIGPRRTHGGPHDARGTSGLLPTLRLVPFAAAALLALKVAGSLTTSPHITNIWILGKAQTAEERASRDYLVYFRDHDFFPWEMRQAANYVAAHTQPSDRVQIYGMDPYVLFLARRLSATPYVYAYDINADAALGGSWMPTGLRPNGYESERIRALHAAHVRDLTDRLKQHEPAAFVFFDKSPLISNESAWIDFKEQCPEAAELVENHYAQTAAFGEVHVFLRRDVADGSVAASPLNAAQH
jgi:hypothetical protein